ncbi:Linear gramicidin dehydrogenase LgrE [Enhygromyxa salina]|uniref:Linear gramicidin dehydrogenase LgrE n=1 Tax=Enhygromyxa salina TaxID=215803 RepID=A0A2S9XXQ6_9BACT|nr:thioesterase domain-containing protein [Enhygromyxa salina]PRP97657.1 Linear gramicidin dehydrogenase LgrE [Enhygromyxa salina]
MQFKDAPELTRTWLACPRARPDPSVRLLSFHHAGGSPSAFRPWLAELPAHVELLPVRLAGREARLRQTPVTSVAEVVEPLADAVAPLLAEGIRLALFGHSLGALLAFEFAREMRRRELPRPEVLVVSGRNAPGLGRTLRLHELDDRELVDEVQRIYGGIPQAILNEPELLALTLPVLRADLTINETHAFSDEPPLELPIHAFGGVDDPHVGRAGLEGWAAFTSARFEWAQSEGDHFYLASPAGKRWLLAKLIELAGDS